MDLTGNEKKKKKYLRHLTKFASGEPVYVERAREFLQTHGYSPESDGEAIEQLIDLDFRFISRYNSFFEPLREMLKRFANPESYSYFDYGSREEVQVVESDPDYPMLVPVFNIQFEEPGKDPIGRLKKYNKKQRKHYDDIFEGKKKREDVFSERQIEFVDNCTALVFLVEGMFLSSDRDQKTSGVVAIPSFPYELMKEHSGGREGWMNYVLENRDFLGVYNSVLRGEI